MQFKLTSSLALFALITTGLATPVADPDALAKAGPEAYAKAFPEPEAAPAPVSSPEDEPGHLMNRACNYNTGCRSMPKSSSSWTGAGKYCGFCYQVTTEFVEGHIYQVNGGTGSGSCCSYGANSGCQAEWNRNKRWRQCANTSKGY